YTPDTPKYQHALEYIRIRGYQLTVDKLEGLVVQQLFELRKANMSQTGYKMCSYISKALMSRSKAIQHALQVHNRAAQ
ncbi:hypothetical protein JB92DRAFT_2620819, partial [Gautieria morchelliformis]